MANLKDIRTRISSVQSIQQVTRAMKLVASAKLRKAQQNMEQARPYAARIDLVLKHLLPDIDRGLHPLLSLRSTEQRAFVVVTADRGLCGSFNTNILKRAKTIIDEYGKDRSQIICIGRKGRDFFRKRDYNVIISHTDFWRDLEFSHAVKFSEEITSRYLQGDFHDVRVIFNEFKNVAQQEIEEYHFLPLVIEEEEAVEYHDFLFEPDADTVVSSLVPRHLNVQMWHFLLESNAAEQAARRTAMDNATENAGELLAKLRLEFNKARQSAITTEILEVVSGAEALTE